MRGVFAPGSGYGESRAAEETMANNGQNMPVCGVGGQNGVREAIYGGIELRNNTAGKPRINWDGRPIVFRWRQGVMSFPPRRPSLRSACSARISATLQLAYEFTPKDSSSPGFQVLPIRRCLNEMIGQKRQAVLSGPPAVSIGYTLQIL